jgi:hypothetical protein
MAMWNGQKELDTYKIFMWIPPGHLEDSGDRYVTLNWVSGK